MTPQGMPPARPDQVMSIHHLFFEFDGRIPRLMWWAGMVLLLVPSILLLSLLQPQPDPTEISDASRQNALVSFFALLLIVPEAAITTKRFNDRGHPAWVAQVFVLIRVATVTAQHFGFFIDLENMSPNESFVWVLLSGYSVWLVVDNGLLRGTDGPNTYGPDPLREQST